jgi:hypothetical protein
MLISYPARTGRNSTTAFTNLYEGNSDFEHVWLQHIKIPEKESLGIPKQNTTSTFLSIFVFFESRRFSDALRIFKEVDT